ncbi:hypothetical protein ABIF69_005844 [Bradyrhizobium japonicum]
MNLRYSSCWFTPGYRKLTIELKDDKGNVHDLHLTPRDVERMAWACHEAARSGEREPIDWEQHPQPLSWPASPRAWKPLPKPQSEADAKRADAEFPTPLRHFIAYDEGEPRLHRGQMFGYGPSITMSAARQWAAHQNACYRERVAARDLGMPEPLCRFVTFSEEGNPMFARARAAGHRDGAKAEAQWDAYYAKRLADLAARAEADKCKIAGTIGKRD